MRRCRRPLSPDGLSPWGLFVIEECHALLRQGGRMEFALGVPKDTRLFRDKPIVQLDGLLGAEGAGWIVYIAILCARLYAAITDGWLERYARWWLPALFILVVVARFARTIEGKSSMGSSTCSQRRLRAWGREPVHRRSVGSFDGPGAPMPPALGSCTSRQGPGPTGAVTRPDSSCTR
jgi:hypothetical protein